MAEQIGISESVVVEVTRAQVVPDVSYIYIVIFILLITAIIYMWYRRGR